MITSDATVRVPMGQSIAISTSPLTRNASVSHEVTGAPGSRNVGSFALPCFAQVRRRIWHRMMVAHPATMPSAATLRTISKAWSGTTALRPTPRSVMEPVRRIPPKGTPPFDMTVVNLGADPFMPIEWSTRPVL